MHVRDIMETTFVVVGEHTSYKDVAELIYASGNSYVFVVDEANRLTGIISEEDLLRVLFPHYQSYYLNPETYTDPEEREHKIQEVQHNPIWHFMNKEVHTATPDEPIMRAAARMLAKNKRLLPVIEEGILIGMITRKRVYGALYEAGLKQPIHVKS